MFVTIKRNKGKLSVPLMQLDPIDVDTKTKEIVGDWHYWVARGYEF